MRLQVKEIDEEQDSQARKCEEQKELKEKLAHYQKEAKRYCLTTECVLATSEIVHRMDLKVDPCNDFWRYSCGGWLDANQDKLDEQESWGVEDEVEARMRQYIHDHLDSSAQCDDYTKNDCKIRLLYKHCMDTDTIDALGVQPLQDILDDFGGWSALGLYYVKKLYSSYIYT